MKKRILTVIAGLFLVFGLVFVSCNPDPGSTPESDDYETDMSLSMLLGDGSFADLIKMLSGGGGGGGVSSDAWAAFAASIKEGGFSETLPAGYEDFKAGDWIDWAETILALFTTPATRVADKNAFLNFCYAMGLFTAAQYADYTSF